MDLIERFRDWLAVQEGKTGLLSDRTIDSYAQRVKFLCRDLGKPPWQATREDCVRHMRDMHPGTAKVFRPAMIWWFEFLNEKLDDCENIGRQLPRVRNPKPNPRPLAPETSVRLYEEASEDSDPWIRAVILLGLLSGCRAGEARSLRRENIDFPNHRVRVRGNGEERTLPMPPELEHALREQLQLVPPAFTHVLGAKTKDKPMDRTQFYRTLRIWYTTHGFDKGIVPHRSRHSTGTHLHQLLADVRVAQTALGHANMNTTEAYTMTEFDELETAFEKYWDLVRNGTNNGSKQLPSRT